MAQVFNQKPHNKANYGAGGLRLLLKDLSINNAFVYVGNLYTPQFNQLVEFFKHYTAASGARINDAEILSAVGMDIAFVCNEMLLKNLRRFLYAGAHTDVAANAAATAVAETFVCEKTGAYHGIAYGRQTPAQRTALAVYNVTDAALLVLNTDYAVETLFGWTFIRMLVDTHAGDTLRVGTGATAVTDYNHDMLAHKKFAPLTRLSQDVACILQFPAKQGVNMQWRIPLATIKPNGTLDWNSQEPSSMPFVLSLLDDSVNNPLAPYGEIEFYGSDNLGVALV